MEDDQSQCKIIFDSIEQSELSHVLSIPSYINKEISEYATGVIKDCATDNCTEKVILLNKDFENNYPIHNSYGFDYRNNKFYCSTCKLHVKYCGEQQQLQIHCKTYYPKGFPHNNVSDWNPTKLNYVLHTRLQMWISFHSHKQPRLISITDIQFSEDNNDDLLWLDKAKSDDKIMCVAVRSMQDKMGFYHAARIHVNLRPTQNDIGSNEILCNALFLRPLTHIKKRFDGSYLGYSNKPLGHYSISNMCQRINIEAGVGTICVGTNNTNNQVSYGNQAPNSNLNRSNNINNTSNNINNTSNNHTNYTATRARSQSSETQRYHPY
eukprot:500262_1